jgi:anaerobic C4-dicarboxylate transporter
MMIVRLAGLLPTAFMMMGGSSDPSQQQLMRAAAASQWLSYAVILIVAIALIAAAGAIARMLVPVDETLSLAIDARQLFIVGVTLLGLYLLVNGLQSAARLGALLAARTYDETPLLQYLQMRGENVLTSTIVYAASGLGLLLGRHALADYAR